MNGRAPTTAVLEPTPVGRAVVQRLELAALDRVNERPFDVNERRTAANASSTDTPTERNPQAAFAQILCSSHRREFGVGSPLLLAAGGH